MRCDNCEVGGAMGGARGEGGQCVEWRERELLNGDIG